MNLLILSAKELSSLPFVKIQGSRAEHILSIQKHTIDDVIQVGIAGGVFGEARIISIKQQEITLKVTLSKNKTPTPNIDLILALPRPQILKHVLQTSAMMGVRKIMLIRSKRVEKSYFESSILETDNLNKYLNLGLAQSKTTFLPLVSVHKKFKPFVEDNMHTLLDGCSNRLLAHTETQKHLHELKPDTNKDNSSTVFAIGPENGWESHEIEMFRAKQFQVFTLGDRILRVEIAVCAIIAQLNLLHEKLSDE